jgi:hypothetical protein
MKIPVKILENKRKYITYLVIILAVCLLLPAFYLIGNYTGYFAHDGEAGNIYELNMVQPVPVHFWAAFYGSIIPITQYNGSTVQEYVTPGLSQELDIIVPDLGTGSTDIYASTVPWDAISPSAVRGVSTVELDAYLNATNPIFLGDSALNTFNERITVNFAGNDLNTIATYTNQYGEDDSQEFPLFVLYDESVGAFLFGTYASPRVGFNGEIIDYQMLVGIPRWQNRTIYFFSDPSDVSSFIGEIMMGGIRGYVTDKNSTLAMEGVEVYIGGEHTTTDADGYYSLISIPEGLQLISATKDTYFPYANSTSIVRYETVRYDLAMDPYTGPNLGNSTLLGIVYHNETNETLANVTINILNKSYTTTSNGQFNFTLIEGRHLLVANKDTFETYNTFVDLELWNTTNISIYLDPFFGEFTNNGTISGRVFDSMNGSLLTNVSIFLGNLSMTTNETGEYYFEIPANVYPFIALKTGYASYIDIVDINISEDSTYDVYLHRLYSEDLLEDAGYITGDITLEGEPYTFENMSVSAGGVVLTNYTDDNFSINIPEGDYYLVAVADDMNPFVSPVSVYASNHTYMNISMSKYTAPGKGPGEGPGRGSGSGSGQGAGVGVEASEAPKEPAIEMPKDLSSFWIAPKEIERTLIQGEFLNEELGVYNLKPNAINITYTIKGDISRFIKLEKDNAIVSPRREDRLKMTLFGEQIGSFVGYIVVKGDIFAAVPITIKVVDSSIGVNTVLVDSQLMTEPYFGEDLNFRMNFNNLLDKKMPIDVKYYLEGDNTSILLDHDVFSLLDSQSLLKSFQLPRNISKGYYTLRSSIEYGDKKIEDRLLLSVIDKPVSLLSYKVFGVIPTWLLMLIAGALIGGLMIQRKIAKSMAKKKRFVFELNKKLLPQKDDEASLFVGKIAEKNIDAYIDMAKLTVHSIVAGTTGGGKSITAQDIAEECLLKDVSVVVFDPTAQWTGMLRKNQDPHFLSLFPKYGMQPSDAKAFPGNVRPVTDSKVIIDIMKYSTPGEITVFTTNTLDPAEYDVFVANAIRTIFKSNLKEFPTLRILLVFDEIHRILPKFGGSGQGFIQIERACREFRKWGLGVLLISQVLQDFVGEIKANINTQVQMKTRDEGDLNAIKMKYGEDYVKGLIKAPVGSGMVQNSAWNRGVPYYVTFRPIMHSTKRLTDEEIDQYNTYNGVLDDLEFQLQQLEEEEQDVLDLKLELKLTKDKLKQGNWNMVKIYSEGLAPRVQEVWTKIGKTPKKYEIERVSEDDLAADVEAAKKARTEFEEKEKAENANKPAEKEEEKKEEAPMDPEMAEANWTSLLELKNQALEAARDQDKGRFMELKVEIEHMPIAKEKKAERDKIVTEIGAANEARAKEIADEKAKANAPPAAEAPAEATPATPAATPPAQPAATPAPAAPEEKKESP